MRGVGVEQAVRQIGFNIFAVAILLAAAVPAHAVPLRPVSAPAATASLLKAVGPSLPRATEKDA